MATVNKLFLMGRVTADPDAPRTTPGGISIVAFRMAVGRSKKNPQTGQWENDPNPLYIDCECFDYPDAKRKLGNVVSQYVKKGDPIFIEGRLQFDQWDDKATGQKRSKHKVIVESIELLGGNRNGNGNGGNNGTYQRTGGGPQTQNYPEPPPGGDSGEDIPF